MCVCVCACACVCVWVGVGGRRCVRARACVRVEAAVVLGTRRVAVSVLDNRSFRGR